VDVNVDMGFYRFISMRNSCCVYTDRRFFFKWPPFSGARFSCKRNAKA